jgi:membrane fusion protein, macrolide-specific efflux system
MRRTRRQWLLNTGLAVGLAAVVGAGVVISTSGNASGADTSALRTVAVRTGDVTAMVTADGSVEAVNEVAANFGTSGTITTLTVKVGDTVTKGERIATVDSAAAARQVEVARLQLKAAKESLSSAEDGTTTTDPTTRTTTTTVNASQVASAKAQVIQAQATYDDAKDSLAATTLYAPISGTVLQVNGKVGQTSGSSSSAGSSTGGATTPTGSSSSSSSSDLVVIANLAALQVSVSVPESDIGSLSVGQTAAVTFPAVPDATAKGTITSIDPVPTTSNSVVSYGVVVRLSGVPKTIRLGQSASVSITTDSASGVLVVPSTAVTTNGSRSTVLLLANGQQQRTQVTVGVVGTTWTEVTSGVKAGDQVVLTTSTSASSSTSGFPGGGFPGGGLAGGGLPGGGVPGGTGGRG